VRHARRLLREYPVKGLRLKPPSPVAVTGGGTSLYRLDELDAGDRRRGAAAAEVRPGHARAVNPAAGLLGPVVCWTYDGAQLAARKAMRGRHGTEGEDLVLLHGATVLEAGGMFREVGARYPVMELRASAVVALPPLETE
jgi:hypothetical protein